MHELKGWNAEGSWLIKRDKDIFRNENAILLEWLRSLECN
jgi:hypothetical protein